MKCVSQLICYSFALVAFTGLAKVSAAQAPVESSVIKLDPAMDEIVGDEQIEKVASGFGFVEGPVWAREGYLLFSDIPHNVINKMTPAGEVSIFLKDSGFSGELLPLPTPLSRQNFLPTLLGSDGLTLDKQGRIIMCEHGNRRVERLEKNGTRTVIADNFEGKKLNSPNDVIVKSDGAIYFTDPFSSSLYTHPQAEIPFPGVYRVKNGKMDLLIKDLKFPNGLAFSPDEKFLYVDDSRGKVYMRYEVKEDGTVGAGAVFFDVSKETAVGVPDGMKVDRAGNVFATGPGGIFVFSPAGKLLGKIAPAESPANLAWGDADGKTLYIAGFSSIYRIHLKTSGKKP